MRIAVVAFNVVLFLFTGVVLLTDGPSGDIAYNLLAALLLGVPVLTVLSMGPRHDSHTRLDLNLRRATVAANVVLAVCAYWAISAQYPHPKEDGVVAYMLLVMVTPIVSALAAFESLRKRPA